MLCGFGSRGKGYLVQPGTPHIHYVSSARVLVLGMGADELFGGYRRLRTAPNVEGWNGLRNELQLDLSRISTRNLGRDNRIISDHGCQGRLPYLDESVVSYVSSLQPWERYFTLLHFVVNFCYSSMKISVNTIKIY